MQILRRGSFCQICADESNSAVTLYSRFSTNMYTHATEIQCREKNRRHFSTVRIVHSLMETGAKLSF